MAVAAPDLPGYKLWAQEKFDVGAFKDEVTAAGQKADLNSFVRRLNDIAKDRENVQYAAQNLVDELISSLDADIFAQAGGANYLRVVAGHLAGIGLWQSSEPRAATDLLGGLADGLRASGDENDQSLARLLDDAIARAPNMYIALVRRFTPDYEEMRELVEEKLRPLLEISYVKNSTYAYYIHAMLSAKYAELALFNAKYDAPLCGNTKNVDRKFIRMSSEFAAKLVEKIDNKTAPAPIAKIRNDMIYQLALNAVVACDQDSAKRHLDQLIGQQRDAKENAPIVDQIYVFRHLRTKRKTKTIEVTHETDKGDVKGTKVIPDQRDTKRKFYNPAHLGMYLCLIDLVPEETNIATVKNKLDEFENVDFWVEISAPEFDKIEDKDVRLGIVRKQLRERAKQLTKSVIRAIGDVFGSSRTARILSTSGDEDRCGVFRSMPRDATVAGFFETPPLWQADTRLRLGGFLSAAEASALADATRKIFPDWFVRIGRPEILD